MDDKNTLACARAPFEADSMCDRGSVDVTAFSGFPVCKAITPTAPDIAIPQVDFPVIPFAPPPCACVDFKIEPRNIVIESREDLYIKFDFKSDGDCCEGNYHVDVDVSVPCITFEIDEGSSEEHDVEVETTCGTSYGGTFTLGIKVDSCTISLDPKLKIVVPEPKDFGLGFSVNMIEAACDESPGAEVVVTSESSFCKKTFNVQMSLKYPHVANLDICDSGDIEISGMPGVGTLDMGIERDSCGYPIMMCPDIKLSIPCPIQGDDIELTAKTHWTDEEESNTVKLTETDPDDCTITGKAGILDIGIPCPIQGDDIEVTARLSWNGNQQAHAIIAEVDKDLCTITGIKSSEESGFEGLELGLPCPIRGHDIKVKVISHWTLFDSSSSSSYSSSSSSSYYDPYDPPYDPEWITLARLDDSECDITGYQRILDIGMPCPIRGTDIKFRAMTHWIGESSESSNEVVLGKIKYCELEGQTDTLDLGIPCPIQGTDLKVTGTIYWKDGSDSDSSSSSDAAVIATIDKEGGGGGKGGGCTLTGQTGRLKLGLKWPLNIIGEYPIVVEEVSRRNLSARGRIPADDFFKTYVVKFGGSDSDSHTGTIKAVTSVECTPGGGLAVKKTKYIIDFVRKTVTALEDSGMDQNEERALARDILMSTVSAIRRDPSILSIIDNPTSREAEKAFEKLGIGIGSETEDDLFIADFGDYNVAMDDSHVYGIY